MLDGDSSFIEGRGPHDALEVKHQEMPPLKKKYEFLQFEFLVLNPVTKGWAESHDQFLKSRDRLPKLKILKQFDSRW